MMPRWRRWRSIKHRSAQAQAALNQAMVDLNNTVIRSPVDGIVISRNVDVGQTVAASCEAPTRSLPLPMTSPKWKCIPTSMKPMSGT